MFIHINELLNTFFFFRAEYIINIWVWEGGDFDHFYLHSKKCECMNQGVNYKIYNPAPTEERVHRFVYVYVVDNWPYALLQCKT